MARIDIGTDIIHEEDNKELISSLVYAPLGVARTYGVVFISEDENQKKLQIHYEIDVICLEETDDENFIFEIFKHQIYINEKKPNILIDELSEQCGKVIYPLQLKVNRQGEILKITNQQQIADRWENKKVDIKQSYNGDEVTLLLQHMDIVIENEKKLTDLIIQRDWFITLFFSPVYNINAIKKKEISLPFIPYAKGVSYEIKNKIKPHQYKEGDILIKQKGTCIDSRGEKDILRGNLISIHKNNKTVNGKINLTYQLYKDSLLPDVITGMCTLDFSSKRGKKMSVEMYNLKNKTPQSSVEKAAIMKKENEEKENSLPKKKKKRFFFFGK